MTNESVMTELDHREADGISNATTETANDYLRMYLGRVGEVYEQRSNRTWRVKWTDETTHSMRISGTFYDFELEKIDE